ncbi:MAG: VOC family protein [Rhizobiaceae bacterium]
MTEITPSRALDHLVLPVVDIDMARRRYEQLGFTVAPDGRHPFGTENCCIFFKDGTFLEPLGIAQRETCEAKAVKGNTFVANDQTYRFRRGEEGFSHLVVKSQDAKADHGLYKAHGISAGRMVRFSRRFTTPDGENNKVSFALAFAADQRSPDSGFFSCQVVTSAAVDRSKLQRHKNGVSGLKEVILSEVNPTDFQYFFQTYLNQREMDVDSFGMSFDAADSKVTVLSPDGMKAFYGMDCRRSERGMLFEAFVLAVDNLNAMSELLKSRQISFEHHDTRLIVPAAPGQGTTLILEEAS